MSYSQQLSTVQHQGTVRHKYSDDVCIISACCLLSATVDGTCNLRQCVLLPGPLLLLLLLLLWCSGLCGCSCRSNPTEATARAPSHRQLPFLAAPGHISAAIIYLRNREPILVTAITPVTPGAAASTCIPPMLAIRLLTIAAVWCSLKASSGIKCSCRRNWT